MTDDYNEAYGNFKKLEDDKNLDRRKWIYSLKPNYKLTNSVLKSPFN